MPDDDRTLLTDADLLSMLRGVTAADHALELPPASIWAGIERGVREGAAGPAAHPAGGAPAAPGSGAASAPEAPALPASLADRRRRRWGTFAAAAAAVAVLAGVVGTVANRTHNDRRVTLAAAQLSSAGLPGAPAGLVGDARVIERGGKEYLHVDAARVTPRSGEYLELWLIDTNVKGMVSLGIVDKGGDYELPAGLRYTDYPIVDISTEPYDGKPTHSGASLLRGKLA